MNYSQYEWALDEAFKKWMPIIAEQVAKLVIEQMEQRFKMDYVSKEVQKEAQKGSKNNVQEVKNG